MKDHLKINTTVLKQKHDTEFYLLVNFAMGLSATLMMIL